MYIYNEKKKNKFNSNFNDDTSDLFFFYVIH